MQILSFDTSSIDVQLALLEDGVVVFEQRIPPALKNRQESASVLLPSIDAALKRFSWAKQNLDLITVGIGPGSFTGVRVSVITARSISQGLGLGLMGLSNLELLASASERPCAVILSAGGGKYYCGAYDADLAASDGGEMITPSCAEPAEIKSSLLELSALDNLLLEPGLDETLFPQGKRALPYPSDLNLASVAALLAYERIVRSGEKLNRESLAKAYPWDNVLPLYLRSPSVTLKANGSSDKTPIGG